MINILYLHAGAELYGSDTVLLQLVQNLDKKVFKPFVVLPCDGPLVQKLKDAEIRTEIINYPILRRKYFNISVILKYGIELYKSIKKIKNFCTDNKIDIIHSNTSAVLEGIFIKKSMKLPLIWHIHEIIVKPKIVYKFISFLISRNADYVVTVSNAVKEYLMQSGFFSNRNIYVIYNGVDNKKFNPENDYQYLKKYYNIDKNDIVVGMIGRINSWKGQNDFIDAINLVLKKNKNITGILIGGVFKGEEWRVEKLKNKIDSLENSKKIIMDGFREDNANIHCLFDIFVLPSINPDPLPTVVLEAMASGKPIVAYNHGGVKEMVIEGFNGLFADVCNPKDLASKINDLITNESIRKTMGINSYNRQRQYFSLESYIRNFEQLYKKAFKYLRW